MNIRKAESTEKDCRLVFNLSNDPEVRANSFSTVKIEYVSHVQWYENAMSDHNLLFFLVFEGDDFVGQIRFKREFELATECVLSRSIVEQFRGKGIAIAFLKLGVTELKKSWSGIKSIAAEVKAENIASNKLFVSAGFKHVAAGTINTYKLDLK